MPVNLTEAAKELRQNSTDAECMLWRHLKARQLDGFKFRRQEQTGRFIADFVCYERSIIVEADEARGIYPQGGEQHTDSPNEAAEEPINDSAEPNVHDINDDDLELEDEDEIDESDEVIEGCPLSIQEALNFKPAELRRLILEVMKTLPNNSCVRKALITIILRKCRILTRGMPRKVFARKVEYQVAAMLRDGHLFAYRSKNKRLKLGWDFTANGQG